MSREQMLIRGYWMHETSGVLAPAVQRYLEGKSLSAGDISLLRAYLKQWITRGNWKGDEELKELRTSVDMISTRADIEQWDALADELGLDPW